MERSLESVASIKEFREKVLGLEGLDKTGRRRRFRQLTLRKKNTDYSLMPSLEKFVDYVLREGTNVQRSEIGWERGYDRDNPRPGSVKTLVYTIKDGSLILFLLGHYGRLDMDAVGEIYAKGERLVRASPEELRDVGMWSFACFGFPAEPGKRDWKIVLAAGDDFYNHPVYLAHNRLKVGDLFVPQNHYVDIMKERFGGRIEVAERKITL